MTRAGLTCTGGWLAFVVAACASAPASPSSGAGAGNGAGPLGSNDGASARQSASASTSAAESQQGSGASGATGSSGSGGTSPQGGGSSSAGAASTSGASTSTAPEPNLVVSGPNAFWQTATWTEVTSGAADVTVDDTTTKQTFYGFGGAFNEVGWNVLQMLGASDRQRALQLLFDSQDGAHFVYGRVPIGANDYAMSRYTDDETKNDYSMTSFSIARDQMYVIPYVQAALAINPALHLWASPWTPPTWMKDNTTFDGGNMVDNAQNLQALALYIVKWVQAYAGQGITIEAIHHQNEPGYNTRYPSCLWTAALYDKFIASYLGPTFASQSVNAQIFLGTMSNSDSGKDGTILSTVQADANAMKYVKGFGLQWNMLGSASGLTSTKLPIVQTEHKCGNYPWCTSSAPCQGLPNFNPNQAPNDYAYGVESWGYITSWLAAGVNVYSAWNMVLDTVGKNLDSMTPWPQNALLTVDTSAKTLTVTPAYYVFRHVSEYVDPGAVVVGTSGGDALAFKNPDGTLVAVVHNAATTSKAMVVAIGGKKLQFTVPANGFATVNPQ